MKDRTKIVAGVKVFWCSRFATYLLPSRCTTSKKFAKGEAKFAARSKSKRGRKFVGIGSELTMDLTDAIEYRADCLVCPGVAKRSMAELREGKLS